MSDVEALRAEVERLRWVKLDLAHARSAGEAYRRQWHAARTEAATLRAAVLRWIATQEVKAHRGTVTIDPQEFDDLRDALAAQDAPRLAHHGHDGYPSDGDCTACRSLAARPAPEAACGFCSAPATGTAVHGADGQPGTFAPAPEAAPPALTDLPISMLGSIEIADETNSARTLGAALTVTREQVDAASDRVQIRHGKSGRARDRAMLVALGVTVVDEEADRG
jgi:hypothetical protein